MSVRAEALRELPASITLAVARPAPRTTEIGSLPSLRPAGPHIPVCDATQLHRVCRTAVPRQPPWLDSPVAPPGRDAGLSRRPRRCRLGPPRVGEWPSRDTRPRGAPPPEVAPRAETALRGDTPPSEE